MIEDFTDMPDDDVTEPKARKAKGMPLDEFASIIAAEIESAKESERTLYAKDRERGLQYYLGKMTDTPSMKGRSKAMSRDVADTVNWILPGLMRVFASSDKVVEYVPTEPGDEEFALQATDFINFNFMRRCNGYRVLWDVFHDALVMRVGIAKFYRDNEPTYSVERYSGLGEDAYQALVNDPTIEILAEESYTAPLQGPDGSVIDMLYYDVKARVKVRDGDVKVCSVPPEEFLIDVEATSIDDARFLCHRTEKTRSQLVSEGYDKAVIDGLPSHGGITTSDDSPEALARSDDFLQDSTPHKMHKSMEYVEVFESYILLDFDGDGEAEWMRCVMAGGMQEEHILAHEEWSDPIPFAEFIPSRVPHRWQGRSVADDTMDVQQIKTVLLRGALDNLYATNNPQKGVDMTAVENVDELVHPQFNGLIRFRGNPQQALFPITTPFVAGESFQMLSYLDDMLEKRTGVSRTTMALDPEALQNQSATAAQLQHDASYSKSELIARNFAEEGMKKLFSGLLKLYVKYQERPETIRLRDKFVTMDPRDWNADMDVSVNVGLGAGSRDRDMAVLMQILGIQQAAVEKMGPTNPLCSVVEISNTLDKVIRAAGLTNPEQYFKPVTPEQAEQLAQQQQQKPDPKAQALQQKVQADIQANQAKMQADMQMNQVKMQADQQASQIKLQSDTQLAQMRAANELQLQKLRIEGELVLSREKMQADIELARERAAMENARRMEEMRLEFQLKQAQIAAGFNGPGDEANVKRVQ